MTTPQLQPFEPSRSSRLVPLIDDAPAIEREVPYLRLVTPSDSATDLYTAAAPESYEPESRSYQARPRTFSNNAILGAVASIVAAVITVAGVPLVRYAQSGFHRSHSASTPAVSPQLAADVNSFLPMLSAVVNVEAAITRQPLRRTHYRRRQLARLMHELRTKDAAIYNRVSQIKVFGAPALSSDVSSIAAEARSFTLWSQRFARARKNSARYRISGTLHVYLTRLNDTESLFVRDARAVLISGVPKSK